MKVGNCPYNAPDDLPAVIPVFPLPAALLLPRAELPLNIFEPRYVAMIDAALASNRVIGMIGLAVFVFVIWRDPTGAGDIFTSFLKSIWGFLGDVWDRLSQFISSIG